MNTVGVLFRRCLVAPAWPLLATAAAVAAVARLRGPLRVADDAPIDAAASQWLLLPWTFAAFLVAATAIETWPLFARQRPGSQWVERLHRGPLGGCGAAALGALLALAIWLTALGLALPAALGGAPAARARHELAAIAGRTLDADHDELAFAVPDAALAELRLRPVALLPAAKPEPTRLTIEVDGVPLHDAPVVIDNTGQLVRVALPERRCRRITLRRVAGNLPLLFPNTAVEASGAAITPGWINLLLAGLAMLVPAAVALAFAVLAAPMVALPVNLILLAGVLALQTLAGIGPADGAVTAALRGHRLPDEPLFGPTLSSLATVLAVMIAAMLSRRGTRR